MTDDPATVVFLELQLEAIEVGLDGHQGLDRRHRHTGHGDIRDRLCCLLLLRNLDRRDAHEQMDGVVPPQVGKQRPQRGRLVGMALSR